MCWEQVWSVQGHRRHRDLARNKPIVIILCFWTMLVDNISGLIPWGWGEGYLYGCVCVVPYVIHTNVCD